MCWVVYYLYLWWSFVFDVKGDVKDDVVFRRIEFRLSVYYYRWYYCIFCFGGEVSCGGKDDCWWFCFSEYVYFVVVCVIEFFRDVLSYDKVVYGRRGVNV